MFASGGCSMSPCRSHGWSGRTGCPIRRMPSPWRCAARHSGNRRWSCLRVWTGRRCVPSAETPIPNGVPPAATCWCAPASSRVAVRLRLCWRGRSRHEADTRPGEGCQGRGVPGVCQVVAGERLRGGWGTPPGRGTYSSLPQTGLLVGAPGRRTAGSPGITSRACEEETSLDRVGTRSVQRGVGASPGSRQGAEPGRLAALGGWRCSRAGPGEPQR